MASPSWQCNKLPSLLDNYTYVSGQHGLPQASCFFCDVVLGAFLAVPWNPPRYEASSPRDL